MRDDESPHFTKEGAKSFVHPDIDKKTGKGQPNTMITAMSFGKPQDMKRAAQNQMTR